MAFKNRKRIGSRLFGKFSLKTKVIIFCVLCIFSIALIGKDIYMNKKNENVIQKSNNITENSVIKPVDEKKDEEKKYDEAQKLFSNKKYSDTIAKADEIINEDKEFYKAYNIKGIALCYSNNYEEGMKNIDKALEINSNFGYARFNKALAYELYGKYDDALNWYDKDLEIEKYIWSYYGKASIYGRRGDVENTVKFLKIAVDMSPDIKSIAREEKDFDPVKGSSQFQDLIK
ncbi:MULTISPECIES: tetratricopeptide repeat protein [Clostridium]|uniref:Tetratricopeptide repeat protein n=1 Tax=Clostridium ragsdalei P11 TaxID=1353534 RepID=A0A1A6ASD4_9CLOT|nr:MULTISPECIES: hypothetical protein [Clostridium]OBR92979.1 tetratricopeptide repeat protein [Clostridium ragsdalei P11]QXE19066.1 hypothetical protein B5S50_09600 [Clostridium sp. 001]